MERIPFTVTFEPKDHEVEPYNSVSSYLQRTGTIGFGDRPNALVTQVVRKILGFSTFAVAETLARIIERLKAKERPSIEPLVDYETIDEVAEREPPELRRQPPGLWRLPEVQRARQDRQPARRRPAARRPEGVALRGLGFNPADSIFARIESGAVGRREGDACRAVSPSGSDAKYSLFSLRKQVVAMMAEPAQYAGSEKVQAIIDKHIGTTEVPLLQRVRNVVAEYTDRKMAAFIQAVFDRFHAVRQLGSEAGGRMAAWQSMQLTKSLTSVMAVVLRHGPLEVSYDDHLGLWFRLKQDWKEGGFDQIFKPLADARTLKLFKGRAAAVRADRLLGEGVPGGSPPGTLEGTHDKRNFAGWERWGRDGTRHGRRNCGPRLCRRISASGSQKCRPAVAHDPAPMLASPDACPMSAFVRAYPGAGFPYFFRTERLPSKSTGLTH